MKIPSAYDDLRRRQKALEKQIDLILRDTDNTILTGRICDAEDSFEELSEAHADLMEVRRVLARLETYWKDQTAQEVAA